MRAAFPTVAEVVDELRRDFPNVKVIWAIEGERSVGKVPPQALAQHQARQRQEK